MGFPSATCAGGNLNPVVPPGNAPEDPSGEARATQRAQESGWKRKVAAPAASGGEGKSKKRERGTWRSKSKVERIPVHELYAKLYAVCGVEGRAEAEGEGRAFLC